VSDAPATPPSPPPLPDRAPPTAPGAIPALRTGVTPNLVGLLGFIVTCAVVLASPTGFLVVTLCLLVPAGAVGLTLSFVGCFYKPRWYGVAGLAVGLLCILFWGGLFFGATWYANSRAAKYGMNMGQMTAVQMSCLDLVDAVESARASTGSLPAAFDVTQVVGADVDPWGHLYRYTLAPVTAANPYGYTFISDGPDGFPGTADDLDLIKIHPTDGTFPLPPAPPPPAPSVRPAPPSSGG
jgi:hypothetical protein